MSHSHRQSSQSLSLSLPPRFAYENGVNRLRHGRVLSPASPFFNPEPEVDDPSRCPAPAVDSSSAVTRLEVLSGWEVNFSVISLYACSLLSLLYVLVRTTHFGTAWRNNHIITPPTSFDGFATWIFDAASVALPLYFAASLLLAPRVNPEQVWTAALLAVGLFTTNPLTRDDVALLQPRRFIASDAIYAALVYLYLLVVVHSYRELDSARFHSPLFYAPKLIVTALYFALNLYSGLVYHVSLGLVPCTRLITWLILASAGLATPRISIPVLLVAVMDAGFAIHVVNQVGRTAEFLGTVPYVEHRAKQLGFRCFVYQTLAFCACISTLAALIIFILPNSYLYFLAHNPSDYVVLDPPVARLGLAFVYLTWTLVLAFVNLPPSHFLTSLLRLASVRLAPLRRTHIAVWFGLADMVNTDEAEDSPDDDSNSNISINNSRTMLSTSLATRSVFIPPGRSVPMRYRHRELFDSVIVTSDRSTVVPPLYLSAQLSSRSSPNSPYSQITSSSSAQNLRSTDSEWMLKSSASSSLTNLSKLGPSVSRRLRLRKNLFVMETQVLLVNVAYLSYIFGNPREELPRTAVRNPTTAPCSTDGERRGDGNTTVDSSSSSEEVVESPAETQPKFDDGTMFRVDPYRMAEDFGFTVFRYISCNSLNVHAVILVSSVRVIVAFSGTRDASNWRTNANFNREVLDDRLSRFEYDFEEAQTLPPYTTQEWVDNDVDISFDVCDSIDMNQAHTQLHPVETGLEPQRLRRSVSYEEIMAQRACVRDRDGGSSSRSVGEAVNSPLLMRAHTYGATATTQTVSEREPQSRARRPRAGVSMMASAFAHEIRTFGQAKVHLGFLDAYTSVRRRVLGALVELYGGRQQNGQAASLPIFFTGHSLGGAMATFACYETARYYKRIGISRRQDISCTTFGCPRIGNEAFKMRYERLVETHWRFEMAADPIPKIPAILNYVSVGVQVLIDQSGMLLIDPSFIEVQWWGRLSNPYLGYRLHIRASYCMALRTYCKLYRNGADDLSNRFWPFPLRIQTKGFFRQLQLDNV